MDGRSARYGLEGIVDSLGTITISVVAIAAIGGVVYRIMHFVFTAGWRSWTTFLILIVTFPTGFFFLNRLLDWSDAGNDR